MKVTCAARTTPAPAAGALQARGVTPMPRSTVPARVVPGAANDVPGGKRPAGRPAAAGSAPLRRGHDETAPRTGERTPANQSAQKALQILDYFRTHGHARLSELAAHAGLHLSTALRLT